MPGDLISRRTRDTFREHFVRYQVLRTIGDAFEAEGIRADLEYEPPGVGGERRTLVEQHYRTLDFRSPGDVAKLLRVYESVLLDLEEAADGLGGKEIQIELSRLVRRLQRDGVEWRDDRLILPILEESDLGDLESFARDLGAEQIQLQIARIRRSIDKDPAAAIGAAKELLETVCKTILSERGEAVPKSVKLPKLIAQTHRVLQILPDQIPEAAKGAETIRHLLQSLGAIGKYLAQIRNLYGTGHGPEGRRRGVLPRHARLAVNAMYAAALFLVETHEARPGKVERKTGGQA